MKIGRALRNDLKQRLTTRGVTVDAKTWDEGRSYVDRLLGDRISRRAFGDSVAKRREVPEDAQLQKALELLKKARTTQDLLALATDAPKPKSSRD